MHSSTQTSDGDIKLNSDLFDLAEKLQIELQKKDEELAKEKQENQKLSTDLRKEKARANKADGLETELASAQQTIHTFKMAIWKSLTSANLCYNIKVQSAGLQYGYLSADNNNGYLCSGDLAAPALHTARFKFKKNLDGTFSIYSTSKRKYLQVQTNSYQSATYFTLSTYNFNPSKFVLFYDHQQQIQQPGILVDIYSLANGFFLSVLPVGNQNRIVANSRTAPANKFLLVPVPGEECHPVLVELSNNNDVHFWFMIVSVLIIVIIYIAYLLYFF